MSSTLTLFIYFNILIMGRPYNTHTVFWPFLPPPLCTHKDVIVTKWDYLLCTHLRSSPSPSWCVGTIWTVPNGWFTFGVYKPLVIFLQQYLFVKVPINSKNMKFPHLKHFLLCSDTFSSSWFLLPVSLWTLKRSPISVVFLVLSLLKGLYQNIPL